MILLISNIGPNDRSITCQLVKEQCLKQAKRHNFFLRMKKYFIFCCLENFKYFFFYILFIIFVLICIYYYSDSLNNDTMTQSLLFEWIYMHIYYFLIYVRSALARFIVWNCKTIMIIRKTYIHTIEYGKPLPIPPLPCTSFPHNTHTNLSSCICSGFLSLSWKSCARI